MDIIENKIKNLENSTIKLEEIINILKFSDYNKIKYLKNEIIKIEKEIINLINIFK